jgi:hypothetical protein
MAALIPISTVPFRSKGSLTIPECSQVFFSTLVKQRGFFSIASASAKIAFSTQASDGGFQLLLGRRAPRLTLRIPPKRHFLVYITPNSRCTHVRQLLVS